MGRHTSAVSEHGIKPSAETSLAGSGWLAEAVALFLKDVRAELRTKVAVGSVGVFTFASLLLLGLATAALKEIKTVNLLLLSDNPTSNQISAAMRPAWDAPGKMGLLWVLLCFAAFAGLAHTFVHEEEAGTATALRLSMSASAVYAGKLAFNLAVLLVVTIVVTPIYMLMTGMPVGSPLVLILLMTSGCVGLAGAATIVGALVAKARGSGALFGAVGLPMVTVFLLLLMNAAGTLYTIDAPVMRVTKDVGGLFSYGILLITVSALTFGFVWED